MPGLLDEYLYQDQGQEGMSPEISKSGLLGLFNTDQSTNLMMLSGILGALDRGKPADLAGVMMQTNMLRDRRAEKNRKRQQAKSYADKIRGHNPELADMLENNPDLMDEIMGKQVASMFDPETQFYNRLMGSEGGNQVASLGDAATTGGLSPDVLNRMKAASGLPDLSQDEAMMLVNAATQGGGAFSTAIGRIKDDRRQQFAQNQTMSDKQALLDSVAPFIERVAKKNPELAAAYSRNPSQALEALRREDEQSVDPAYISFKSVFDDIDVDKPTSMDFKRISERTGIKNVDAGVVGRLYSGGPKTFSAIQNQIVDEQDRAENQKIVDQRIKAEQTQQEDHFKKSTGLKLADDYDRQNKAYQKAIEVGYRTQDVIKNPRGTGAEQMQVLYDLVKGLDADSAVREGEVGLARMIASYKDTAEMYLQKITEGRIVPEQAIKEMTAQIMNLSTFAEQGQYRLRKKFEEKASLSGADPVIVLGRDDQEIDMKGFKSRFETAPTTDNGWTIVNGRRVRLKQGQ